MFDTAVDLDHEDMKEIAKPLFYGFIFISGISIMTANRFAGTMLGLAVLSAISFIATGLSKNMDDDWQRFLDLIAITSILLVVVFASYMAAKISMI